MFLWPIVWFTSKDKEKQQQNPTPELSHDAQNLKIVGMHARTHWG